MRLALFAWIAALPIVAVADVTASFRMTSSVGGEAQAQTGTWFQSAAGIRIEMATPMGKSVVIIDAVSGRSYLVQPEARSYFEAAPGKAGLGDTSFSKCAGSGADACLAQQGFRKTGSASVNGADCDLWERAAGAGDGRGAMKVWRPKKGGQPGFARVAFDHSAGHSTQIDVVSVKEGTLATSLFQVPAGFQKQELPGFPGAGAAGGRGLPPGFKPGRMPTQAELEKLMKQYGAPGGLQNVPVPSEAPTDE